MTQRKRQDLLREIQNYIDACYEPPEHASLLGRVLPFFGGQLRPPTRCPASRKATSAVSAMVRSLMPRNARCSTA